MQQVLFQPKDFTGMDSRACRKLPGHGTGVQQEAANDDCYDAETSAFWLVLSVAGNVIGGALLLYGLVLLPHIVADLLG